MTAVLFKPYTKQCKNNWMKRRSRIRSNEWKGRNPEKVENKRSKHRKGRKVLKRSKTEKLEIQKRSNTEKVEIQKRSKKWKRLIFGILNLSEIFIFVLFVHVQLLHLSPFSPQELSVFTVLNRQRMNKYGIKTFINQKKRDLRPWIRGDTMF